MKASVVKRWENLESFCHDRKQIDIHEKKAEQSMWALARLHVKNKLSFQGRSMANLGQLAMFCKMSPVRL